MLLATLVVALLLGSLAQKIEVARKQQRAAKAILSLGGRVAYAYQRLLITPLPGGAAPRRVPPGPRALRWLLGEHFFARAVVVTYPIGATDDDLKHLDDLPYLTEIHLHCPNVTAAGLSHVWKHEGLNALGLRGASIGDADVANLESLAQLESLELCHTPITDKAVETLRRLPNLRSVQLEGTLVSHEAGSSLPRDFAYAGEETWGPAPSEEQREIAVALERDGAHVAVRQPISGTESKYYVTWSHQLVDDRKLDLLERLEALRGLVLAYMSIDHEHWARIAGDGVSVSSPAHATDAPSNSGKGLRQLEFLILRDVAVTDEDMVHIKKLAHLKRLSLRETRLTDAGLAHLPSLANLEELGLGGPDFTDAGLIHLAGLPKLKRLELSGGQFTDDGLGQVGALSQLEALWLWDNTSIGDAGLAHLAPLKNLQELVIDSPNITDAGLAHVAKLSSLTHLSVYRATVSDAGLEQLRRLPRLESGSVNETSIIHPLYFADPEE